MPADDPVAELAGLIADLPEELFNQALTHASWVSRRIDSFERLAFLGDSVLALAIAGELHEVFRELDAGGLTKVHNQTVSGVSCTAVGEALGVPEMLRGRKPADFPGAIEPEVLISAGRPIPEVTEALIGACYLAFGFEATADAVVAAFDQRMELAAVTRIDFKSALQEMLARRGQKVRYEVLQVKGPAHRRSFDVAATVDRERVGVGSGRSKKEAEQRAAEQAFERLDG